MKNKKMKSMLLGLAGATIMTNAFAAAPTIIDPSTTLDVVNAENGNIIISDVYRYDDDFNGAVGKEDGLTVTKFIGNTKADSKDKVYILDGDVKIANLAETLNGSKLEKVNGEPQKVNPKSVVLAKEGVLKTTADEIFSKDKNAINENVAPYLVLNSGYLFLNDTVSKKEAYKYRDVLAKSKSDTGIFITGKLVDDNNHEVKAHSVSDAMALADKKIYSLSTTVEIQGKDVNKVVFTNEKEKLTIEDNTMYIPKAIYSKNIKFAPSIKDVQINDIGSLRNESINAIYEESDYPYKDMGEGDSLLLGNKEQGGIAISGGDKLKITINDDSGIVFAEGPSNIVDAEIQINLGGINVDGGATATFNKVVKVNDKKESQDSEINDEHVNFDVTSGKIIFKDNLYLEPGILRAGNSEVQGDKEFKVNLNGSEATFENSKVNINDLSLFDGGYVGTDKSDVELKSLSTDDRYSNKDKYFENTKQGANGEDAKKAIADESVVEFIDSNVNIKEMAIEGNSSVIFDNEKNDKVYNVNLLNAYRGGNVELKGGTLKVNEFIGSSYIPNKEDQIKDAPEGTYSFEGKITLSGGILEANNLKGLLSGDLISTKTAADLGHSKEELAEYKKGIIKDKAIIELKGNATIKTKTDQIFANAAGEKVVDAGDVANKAIDYEAGILEFNDAKYTREYLKTARTNLAKEHDNKSTTKILMTGDQVDLKGNVVENITLEEALENSNATDDANNTVLNTKTIVLPENKVAEKLVIGTASKEEKDKAMEADQDLQGPDIDASQVENLKEIVVNNGRELTLGGKGKELIAGLKEGKEITYTVKGEGSELTFGNSDLTKNVDDLEVADITVANEGKLKVDQANLEVKGRFVTKDVASIAISNNGTLTLDNTKAKPEDEDKVSISKDTTIYVGDDKTNGKLELTNVSLNGARVLVDPNWDNDIYSEVNIYDMKDNVLDGRLVVGRNSVVNVDALEYDQDNTDTIKGENEAVLGIYNRIKLDEQKGSILVNPQLSHTDKENNIKEADTPANTVTFTNNTQLRTAADSIVAAANDKEALLSAGTINLPKVDEKADNYGAQAYITGNLVNYAKIGGKIENNEALYLVKADKNIENNFKNVDFDLGSMINLTAEISKDKKAIELVHKNKENKSVFNKVKEAFPKENILLTNTIDGALANLEKAVKDNVNKPDAKLSTPATDALDFALAQDNRAQLINSMANMADLGGVTKESYGNLAKFTDTVEEFHKENDLWATYTHSNNNSDVELTCNKASYSAKGNGLVMGGSLAKNDHRNLGMAVFYNKGKVTANSGVQTKNDVKSYGIGLYQTNKLGKGEIVSQIAYSHNANDLTQFNGVDVKAKANTSNYSLAVKYEQDMAKANANANATITPYVGLRFAHLGGANFTNSLGFNYDVAASNVVSMPLGVKYAGNIQKGKATIAPFAELGYTPVLSGKNHKVKVGLNAATDSFTNTVLDNTWHAKVGANITKGNNTFGLSYGHYQGKETKDNQIMAKMEVKF